MGAARAIAAELNPKRATAVIVSRACEALHAERATLWAIDPASDPAELVAMVTEDGAESLSLKGIAD